MDNEAEWTALAYLHGRTKSERAALQDMADMVLLFQIKAAGLQKFLRQIRNTGIEPPDTAWQISRHVRKLVEAGTVFEPPALAMLFLNASLPKPKPPR